MNMDTFWDILRFVLLICQIIGVIFTIISLVITRRVGINTLLNKLFEWYKDAMSDGKITPEEMTNCIKMIKDLAKISNKDTTSNDSVEEKKE